MKLLGKKIAERHPIAINRLAPQDRAQSIALLTIVVTALSLFAMAGFLLLLLQQYSWQLALLTIVNGLTALTGFLAYRFLYPRKQFFLGLVSLGFMFGVTSLVTAAALNGMGIPAAVVYLMLTLIISATLVKEWQGNVVIGGGIIIAGACALLPEFSPLGKISIDLIGRLTPFILIFTFLVFVIMLALQFVMATLRIRLVTVFLTIVIIPLIGLSVIQSGFMFDVLDNEVQEGLSIAAQQTALRLDNYLEQAVRSADQVAELDTLRQYLELAADQRAGSSEEAALQRSLDVLAQYAFDNQAYLSSYGLIDMEGNTLYDTLYRRIPTDTDADLLEMYGISPQNYQFEGDQDYFLIAARSGVSFISPMRVSSSLHSYFYISAPVKNASGQTIGVLRARMDGQLLQDLIVRYSRLVGNNSYAVLLDENNIRLADAFTPDNLYKSVAPLPAATVRILQSNFRLPRLPVEDLSTDQPEFDNALNAYQSMPFFSAELSPIPDENGRNEIGAVTRIQTMPWKVVYLQADFSNELLQQEQRRLSILVTTVVAVLVAAAAVLIAQLLSRPISKLTRVSQKVTAGDLQARAPEGQADEFGLLGAAFNLMTERLRASINELEERVVARTQEIEIRNEALEHRARQIQTISEVARQIVSSQELETFLSSITHLVSERFHFYHVGIFLLDDTREYAVLRAANSTGGQRMLARHHMLEVGKVGIVGRATGSGQATIATDVGTDRSYFNNPDLPETRSEIALPLKVNDETIGALDIQSKESNAFQQEDIALFTTLADQIAIAIYNNQLFNETTQALNEAHNLHQKYLRSEWASEMTRRKVRGYLYNRSGVSPQNEENPLWKQVFATGDPVFAALPDDASEKGKSVMAVPISVRGETIGVIHVQEPGAGRAWAEEEIAVVNSVASQVASALENARLFENTVRRAEREKKVSQITAKIRATNDPEEMMQIAVSELQQALLATRAQIYIRQDTPQPGSEPNILDEDAS